MSKPCNIMQLQNYYICSTQKSSIYTLKAICNLPLYTYGFQIPDPEGTYCLKIIASNGDDKMKIGIIELKSYNFCSIYVLCFVVIIITRSSFAFEIFECCNYSMTSSRSAFDKQFNASVRNSVRKYFCFSRRTSHLHKIDI